ncbi:ROK family protein [Myxococcota bacterium]|nr:ROK family protein [Myxococcota bacterium]MCZ7617820.1 ROK family protein [Myxococcota bacterium]
MSRLAREDERTEPSIPADAQHGIATLAIDIGGSGLKATVLDPEGSMLADRVRIDTPDPASPEAVVEALVALVAPLPAFDRISVGFPGVVRSGTIVTAPNLGSEQWQRFPLADVLQQRLGDRPTRVLNDADVQGYGAICGHGLEFVITLGTGLGSALFRDGERMPHLEFAQFPFRKKKTLDRYLGAAALEKVGKKKWNRRVGKTIDAFRTLLHFDTLYIGGGNARKLSLRLPRDVKIVSNDAGLTGGLRLWDDNEE